MSITTPSLIRRNNPCSEYNLFIRNDCAEKEIIGVIKDNVIYTGKKAIELLAANDFDDIFSKERAYFMSKLDLGAMWDKLTEMPVICVMRINNADALKQLE